jgi:glycosyltransferase involved in cell wall biosynthesis
METSLNNSSVESAGQLKLSIIVPIYNEEKNIPLLYERLDSVLRTTGHDYEIIMVNDGSKDGSLVALRELTSRHQEVKVLDLKRNSGQTAALMCGIDHSSGDIIIPIDADLQNDPADIPHLLAKLNEGYDVVSGWRQNRQDAAFRRNFVSMVANRVISAISGVKLRDYGCSLKAYRRSVLDGVRLYGEMHRFVPIYASWMGARITEIPVAHAPRIHGKSKYGLERIAKVILDLIVVKFLDRHLVKPIYVFGGFGLLSIAVSLLALLWGLYLKFVDGLSLIQTPLPLFSAMALLAGITAILLGLMSEILVRTYFESQDKRPYYVRERLNL